MVVAAVRVNTHDRRSVPSVTTPLGVQPAGVVAVAVRLVVTKSSSWSPNDTWGGTFRCVAYARAEIPSDLAADPFLAEVAWTWLVEALASHGAEYSLPSGTVTKVTSDSFGGMADEGGSAQLEIRASWTPEGDVGPHVEAWGELMCTAAGLPPLPAGVVSLPRRLP